jgi:transcriptional regulator with XRE-family HTH domain
VIGRSFGERLRGARGAARLSQSELERRSGIPKTTLSRYENGHVEPSLATLARLAKALGTTEADLLPGAMSFAEHLYRGLVKRGVIIRSAAEADRVAQMVSDQLNAEGTVASAANPRRPR